MSFFSKKKKQIAGNEPSSPTASNAGPLYHAHQRLPRQHAQASDSALTSVASQSPMAAVSAPGGLLPAPTPTLQHNLVYPWSQRELHMLPLARPDEDRGTFDKVLQHAFPRYGHSANSIGATATGDIYIFGGLIDRQQRLSNTLYILSSVLNRSDEPSPAPPGSLNIGPLEMKGEVPSPRFGHASVGVGNVLIVWGGDTKISESDETSDNALYLLNLSTREWTRVEVTGDAPECRYGHTAAMIGSRFYIYGGQHADSRFLGDLWSFDLQKLKAGLASWYLIQPDGLVPPRRTGHTCVAFGDSLYIFGGTDGQYHYNDTWQFNTTTKTWKELLCIGYIPVPREGHSATLVDDVMYIFGGRGVDGKDLDDLAAFKITNQRWYMFQNMGPAPSGRSGHAMTACQAKIFVLGGESFPPREDANHRLVHILDTSKIKYPQDQTRGTVARKTQEIVVPRPQQNSFDENLRQRAASPVDATLSTQTQSILQSAIPSTSGQPEMPASDDIAPPRRPMRAEDHNILLSASQAERERMSLLTGADVPVARSNTPIAGLQSPGNSTKASANPAGLKAVHDVASDFRSLSPSAELPPRSASVATAEVQSPEAVHKGPVQQFMKSTSDAQIVWLRVLVAQAFQEGLLSAHRVKQRSSKIDAPDTEEFEDLMNLATTLDPSSEIGKLARASASLKQEIGRLKSIIARQAANAEAQIGQATQARNVALSDAVGSRARLAAQQGDSMLSQDQHRIARLEDGLSQTLRVRKDLEEKLVRLRFELQQEKSARHTAETRSAAAGQRAEATEASYAHSLKEYADIQRRTHGHEAIVQGHLASITDLRVALQRSQADHTLAEAKLNTSKSTVEEHLRTLEQMGSTLAAANAQTDETRRLWMSAKSEAADAKLQIVNLQAALDAAKHESAASSLREAELQRVSELTREEYTAMRALTHGGLSDLLATSKARLVASPANESSSACGERLRQAQKESRAYRDAASELRSKHDEALKELADSRFRANALEQQILQISSDHSCLRSQHATALDEKARLEAHVAQRDLDLHASARRHDATLVTLSMMQNALIEQGLAVESIFGNVSPALASMSQPQLIHRIHELESRLESLAQSQSASGAFHEGAVHESQEISMRAPNGLHRLHGSSSRPEDPEFGLENAKILHAEERDDRNISNATAEVDLQDLQEKHRVLEASHQKAVQYVKGTEKMLRRMKEELTKQRSRVEELELDLADRTKAAVSSNEIDQLKSDLSDMQRHTEKASKENEGLNARIASLQTTFDRTIEAQEHEHRERTEVMQHNIRDLQSLLSEAKVQLATTSHQADFGTDVANSARNSIPTPADSGNFQLLRRELAASQSSYQNASLAFMERDALESKLNEANGKISLLLDVIERSGAASSLSGHDPSSSIEHGSYAEFWSDVPRPNSTSDAASVLSEDFKPDTLLALKAKQDRQANGRAQVGD